MFLLPSIHILIYYFSEFSHTHTHTRVNIYVYLRVNIYVYLHRDHYTLSDIHLVTRASLIAQVKNPPAMQENLVLFLGQEDPLEKGWATHSSILGLPSWLTW